jgi:hypothetical protein
MPASALLHAIPISLTLGAELTLSEHNRIITLVVQPYLLLCIP